MRAAKKIYQTLSARELLEMVTIRPARALKLESELGKIAPGYLADAIAIPFKGSTLAMCSRRLFKTEERSNG